MSDTDSDEELDWHSLDSKVLKRGEKDHAPDGTDSQEAKLQKSRESMYSAISKPTQCSLKQLVECDWIQSQGIGQIRKMKGKYFTTMGWSERDKIYVLPEEICYLCQRGSMACYLNDSLLSIEAVMALCLPLVDTDKLTVYSHLKKLGYVVRRDTSGLNTKTPINQSQFNNSIWPQIGSPMWWIFGSKFTKLAWKPIYFQYSSVYKDLAVVKQKPFNSDNVAEPHDYLVWKPSTKFKKSQPDNADYFIKVCSAEQALPKLAELESELGKIKLRKSDKKSIVARMRDGNRSSLLAVVDNGVVSFVRMGETLCESTGLA